MRIETRNLLADFLLAALDDPIVANALHCLAAYCRSHLTRPVTISIDEFVAPASITTRQQVANILRHHALLNGEEHNGAMTITLHARFTDEYDEIAARLQSYSTALATWRFPYSGPDLVSTRKIALQKGVLLFNQHLFFEVHEILEEQWKQEEGEERLFLQGLIQIAVAFHHLLNNNFRGASALLHDGLAKIIPYQPQFLSIEVQRFVERLTACQQGLRRLGPEHCQQFPWEMIPSIKFGGSRQ